MIPSAISMNTKQIVNKVKLAAHWDAVALILI
jgi:hypothetical protein